MTSPLSNPYLRPVLREIRRRGDYPVIERYVSLTNEESINPRNLRNLMSFLMQRGYIATPATVRHIAMYEYSRQNHDDVKRMTVTRIFPSRDDILREFIRIYGNYSELQLFQLAWVLYEQRLSHAKLQGDLERIRGRVELDRFDRRLYQEEESARALAVIDTMDGDAFREHIASLFQKAGYLVSEAEGISGADLFASRFRHLMAVRTEHSGEEIGIAPVDGVWDAVREIGADGGMVVTNAPFSSAATRFALINRVNLVDRRRLAVWCSDCMKAQEPEIPA
jgi:hypothetical protein